MPRIEYKKHEIVGKLKYINDVGKNGSDHRVALFECSCGKTFKTTINNAKSYNTTSCGCQTKNNPHNLIHGDNKKGHQHYIYRLWQSIKRRCYNPNSTGYKWWGGRGITMHEAWRNDYLAFKNYILSELGERPKNKTLDRINCKGNYEPGNLRWANHHTQRINRYE